MRKNKGASHVYRYILKNKAVFALMQGRLLEVIQEMQKECKSISFDHKFCKDCIYNESADDKEYSAKLICDKHSNIVDVRDEACPDFEERREDNNDTE